LFQDDLGPWWSPSGWLSAVRTGRSYGAGRRTRILPLTYAQTPTIIENENHFHFC